jgi:hypothetical protein
MPQKHAHLSPDHENNAVRVLDGVFNMEPKINLVLQGEALK